VHGSQTHQRVFARSVSHLSRGRMDLERGTRYPDCPRVLRCRHSWGCSVNRSIAYCSTCWLFLIVVSQRALATSSPLAISIQVNPTRVGVEQISELTIQILNPNVFPETGVVLVDSLIANSSPTGLVVAVGTVSNTCFGTLTATGTTIALSGGIVQPASSCTIVVPVASPLPATYVDTIPPAALVTTQGDTNGLATSAELVVLFPPTVSKQFSPDRIVTGGFSTLSITLGNSNSSAIVLTSDLVDAFPTGLTVAGQPNIASTCPGTVLVTSASVTLANGSLVPPGGCAASVNVVANMVGNLANIIPVGALQTSAGMNPTSATATLTASEAPSATALTTACELTFVAGQSFDMTATVTGFSPSGSSTFYDGGGSIGGCTAAFLSSGVASCLTSNLLIGVNDLTAAYSGDANNQASNSSSLIVSVLDPADVISRNGFEADILGCPSM
jgi:hypothetical protein